MARQKLLAVSAFSRLNRCTLFFALESVNLPAGLPPRTFHQPNCDGRHGPHSGSDEGILKKRTIKAKALARDVHAGMGDSLLMKKYQLSAKELETVLKRLVEADLISHLQLYERTSLSDTQVTRAFVEAQQAIRELD